MKKLIIAIFLMVCVLLGGCVSFGTKMKIAASDYKSGVHSMQEDSNMYSHAFFKWKGMKINDFIKVIGAPDEIDPTESDGSLYKWMFVSKNDPRVSYAANLFNDPEIAYFPCQLLAMTNHGIITSMKTKGLCIYPNRTAESFLPHDKQIPK